MAEEKSGAPRKRFTLGKIVLGITLGVLVSTALLGAAKLYLGRRINSPKVTEPPPAMRELIKACGVETPPKAERQAPAGAATKATGAAEDELQNVRSHEEYLRRRVRRNPRDEAAVRHLEFLQLVQAKDFQKDCKAVFEEAEANRPQQTDLDSPPAGDMVAWVGAHRREFAALERLCQTSGSLELAPGELATLLAKMDYFDYASHFYGKPDGRYAATRLLTSDARIQLAQGRPEAAQRDYLMLLALAAKTPRWDSSAHLAAFLGGMRRWMSNPQAPAPDWRAFIAPLDAFSRSRLTRERRLSDLGAVYLGVRNYWGREQMWRKHWFQGGYGAQDKIPIYLYVVTFEIPNPRPRIHRAVSKTFYEERIPHWLESFDRQWQAILERARRPWPEAARMTPKISWMPGNLLEGSCPLEAQWQHYHMALEARANVLRAGLRLMSGEGAGAAERSAEAVRKDPHSPWRDPFTEAPLRVVEETTQTLIYSLGPDLIDQQGKVEYGRKSQNDGEFDAGDIILRVPRPKI